MGEGSFSGCTFIRGAHLRGGPLSFSTSCLQTRNPVRDQPLCSTFLGCGVLCLIALLHTAAVVSCSCALLLYIGHPGCCSGAPSLGCLLAGLKRPSSAVLPVLVPPLARSVFCPGPHIPVRASCSWPLARQLVQGPVCAVSVGPSADGQARGSVPGCGAGGLIGGHSRIPTGACASWPAAACLGEGRRTGTAPG